MIYLKNCLKTILQSWEWIVLADKDIFKLLMQYKYVQTSGFKNPVLFKRLGLSFYDYKHLYFFLVCDLSYLILRMYIWLEKELIEL